MIFKFFLDRVGKSGGWSHAPCRAVGSGPGACRKQAWLYERTGLRVTGTIRYARGLHGVAWPATAPNHSV